MADPCECLFSHEALMRRLLSALRDSQNSECTDTNCEDDPTGMTGNGLSFSMLLTLWGVAALVLFLTRPVSMRLRGGDRQANEKQRINRDDEPPFPPPPDVQ